LNELIEIQKLIFSEFSQGVSDVVVSCLSGSSSFIVRSVVHSSSSSNKDEVLSQLDSLFVTIITDLFKKMDPSHLLPIIESVLPVHWPGVWSISDHLLRLSFSPDLRHFRRQQAAKLLSVSLKNHQVVQQVEKSMRKTFARTLFTNTTQLLRAECTSPEQHPLLIKELIQVVISLHSAWSDLDDILSKGDILSDIKEALKEYAETAPQNNKNQPLLKNTINKLANIYSIQINRTTAKEREISGEEKGEEEGEEGEEKKKGKKRKKKKKKKGKGGERGGGEEKEKKREGEARKKQKKQAKMTRLNTLSEGMEQIRFS